MKKFMAVLIGWAFLTGVLHAEKKRGYLGVYAHEPSEAVKIALGIDYGVIVDKVIENSPAEKGGVEKGDVILKIEGEKITDMDDFIYLVKKNPNKEVKIEISRKGKKKSIKVKLGEKEEKELIKKKIMKFKMPGCEEEFEVPEWHGLPGEVEKEIKMIVPPYKEEIEKLKKEVEELRKRVEKLEKK